MDQLTEHFSRHEFQCSCPCQADHIQNSFVHQLERARVLYGDPMPITSGVRCSEHNAKVGGVESSAHVTGWASDIACTNSHSRFKLIDALLTAGFHRIGIAKTFIHADMDPSKAPSVAWLY